MVDEVSKEVEEKIKEKAKIVEEYAKIWHKEIREKIENLNKKLNDPDETVSIKIIFPDVDEERRQWLRVIEHLLGEIGVNFDTGFNLKKNEREWYLDWSLSGAKIDIH